MTLTPEQRDELRDEAEAAANDPLADPHTRRWGRMELAVLDALDTAEAERDAHQERVAILTTRVRDSNALLSEWGHRLITITSSEHLASSDGDADWGVIWERAGELRTRATSAEASRDVARARTRGAVRDYEEQCRRADNAEEAMTAAQRQIQDVRALHQPYVDAEDDTVCRECSYVGGEWGLYPVEHPCPTIQALDHEAPDDPSSSSAVSSAREDRS